MYISASSYCYNKLDCYKCCRFVLKNLQPGEAVVIVDYKMKLELGMRSREIQRDWYGKRGISLHGFYVIAQVAVGERRIEVLDLWCEDTKQDAWFTQSAFDVGFAWIEKVFPNFQVYLFSGECRVNKNSLKLTLPLPRGLPLTSTIVWHCTD